jgi:hypothetical protein
MPMTENAPTPNDTAADEAAMRIIGESIETRSLNTPSIDLSPLQGEPTPGQVPPPVPAPSTVADTAPVVQSAKPDSE